MPSKKLSSTLLAALGLSSTACGPCLNMVACLSMKYDSEDTDTTGPCLSPIDTDTGRDTGTGPCLDYYVDTGCDSNDTGCDTGDSTTRDTGDTDSGTDSADSGDTATPRAVRGRGASIGAEISAVLERQVLPEDVVRRLRARRPQDR